MNPVSCSPIRAYWTNKYRASASDRPQPPSSPDFSPHVAEPAGASQPVRPFNSSRPTALANDDVLRSFFLKNLHKPVVSPADTTFKPYDAFEWQLPEKAHWQQPMGENLCIIDLDNRQFNQSGELYGPDVMSWDSPKGVHGLSLGLLNHYVYGMHMTKQGQLLPRASWDKVTLIA